MYIAACVVVYYTKEGKKRREINDSTGHYCVS